MRCNENSSGFLPDIENGWRLVDGHAAPLRLIVPVKYGIKNLKRVGSIAFSDQRPRDYWALRGYDYYSGL